jgi:hypothetical protein
MTLSFLVKSVSTLGLAAAISVGLGVSVQQALQAQTSSELEARLDNNVAPERQAQFCAGDYSSAPARFLEPDGNLVAYDYLGIELSPEQQAANDQYWAKLIEEAEEQIKSVPLDVDPANGVITHIGPIKDDGYERVVEIDKFRTTLDEDPALTNQEKVDILNERFADYGYEFGLQAMPRGIFTPEQQPSLAKNARMARELRLYMLSIFTPEQQEVYLENLAIKDMIMAECQSLNQADE